MSKRTTSRKARRRSRTGASDIGSLQPGDLQAEAKKPIREILDEEIREGSAALYRPAWGLVLSGLSAGLDIGFSSLLTAAALKVVAQPASASARLLTSGLYA